jgi:plasmid stabilization system protein ParE
MKTFDSFRPRSGKAAARLRERELKRKLEQLLEVDDEGTFRAGLAEDFGITTDHPKYEEILKIWRGPR